MDIIKLNTTTALQFDFYLIIAATNQLIDTQVINTAEVMRRNLLRVNFITLFFGFKIYAYKMHFL